MLQLAAVVRSMAYVTSNSESVHLCSASMITLCTDFKFHLKFYFD